MSHFFSYNLLYGFQNLEKNQQNIKCHFSCEHFRRTARVCEKRGVHVYFFQIPFSDFENKMT